MDKVLLVTGASSEVGVLLTENIFREYRRIYLQYRTMNDALQEFISEYSGEVEIIPLEADFADAASTQEMIDKINKLGVLPNHIVHLPAPKAYNMYFHKDKWENFDLGWNVSVRSAVLVLQAFLPAMAKQHYGRVVFMLTSCTQNYPAKYQSAYVTVKYALLGLMKALSVEYIGKGITVNGISPDMMETRFLSEIPRLIIEQNRAASPIGRNIYVEEVIPVIAHMLSDSGASMTGQNVGITGGL